MADDLSDILVQDEEPAETPVPLDEKLHLSTDEVQRTISVLD
jgi:hypothetical protein